MEKENMKNNKYEEVINKLKKLEPQPESGADLTKNIMNNIEHLTPKKTPLITLNVSEKQWMVFNNFRTIMAIAAAFLIGYFIFQQWEMNDKLNRIESEFISSKQINESDDLVKNTHLQKIFGDQFINKTAVKHKQNEEMIWINKKSLNYLLNAIKELEKENIGYKEKFKKYYTDSIIHK